MFLKMKAVATATAIAGLFAAGAAATAQAGTVVVTSGGNVTATAPTTRLVVNGTTALNCTGSGGTAPSSATATVANGTYTGAAPLTVSSNVAISFNNCSVAGIPFNVTCQPTATLRVTGNTTVPGGTTRGIVDMVDCSILLPLINCTARVTGQVNVSYLNSGTLTVLTGPTDQALNVVSSQCTGVIPTGTARYGGTGAGSTGISDLTYTLGAVKPQLASTGF